MKVSELQGLLAELGRASEKLSTGLLRALLGDQYDGKMPSQAFLNNPLNGGTPVETIRLLDRAAQGLLTVARDFGDSAQQENFMRAFWDALPIPERAWTYLRPLGYVQRPTATAQGGGGKGDALGVEDEVLMECLATAWVALYFHGVRCDHLWSECLRIGRRVTHGWPSGVCTYKAYGDVYRRTRRDLRLLERLNWRWDSEERRNLRVRQYFTQPCILGLDDVGDIGAEAWLDVTPMSFRRLGLAYYLYHQMRYVTDGLPFTLVWRCRDTADLKSERVQKFLETYFSKYIGESVYGQGVRKTAFWAVTRTCDVVANVNLPACVMGLEEGCYSWHGIEEMRFCARPAIGEYGMALKEALREQGNHLRTAFSAGTVRALVDVDVAAITACDLLDKDKRVLVRS